MGQTAKVALIAVLVLLGLVIAVFKDKRTGAAADSAVRSPEPGDATLEGSFGRQPFVAGGEVRPSEAQVSSAPPSTSPPPGAQADPSRAEGTPHPDVEVPAKETADAARTVRTYTVKPGDSFSRIAAQVYGNGSLWVRLHKANVETCADPNLIRPGMVLILPEFELAVTPPASEPAPSAAGSPSGRTHRVGPGDTLSSLAQKYYGDRKLWRRIYGANRERIPDPDRLKVDAVLVIPE